LQLEHKLHTFDAAFFTAFFIHVACYIAVLNWFYYTSRFYLPGNAGQHQQLTFNKSTIKM